MFKCSHPSCSKELNTKYLRKRHEKIHQEKTLFCCNNCSEIYQRKNKFDIHSKSCGNSSDSSTARYCSMVDIQNNNSVELEQLSSSFICSLDSDASESPSRNKVSLSLCEDFPAYPHPP